MSAQEIDWSKAPEWATVFIKGTCSSSFYFEKPDRYERDGGIYRLKADAASFTVYQRPWGGQGLPPVGTVCEVDIEGWVKCEVIAHFMQLCGMVAVFTVETIYGPKMLDAFGVGAFRPIRTPEQIAAEEREAACTVLAGILSGHVDYIVGRDLEMAKYLYDAGYRKPLERAK